MNYFQQSLDQAFNGWAAQSNSVDDTEEQHHEQ